MAFDFEPDTFSLRNSSALPSGSVPSRSWCIESALSFAVRVASTPMGENVVTTGRDRPSTQMSAIGVVEAEVDHHLCLDEGIHRVVVGNGVEHGGVHALQLLGVGVGLAHRANPTRQELIGRSA